MVFGFFTPFVESIQVPPNKPTAFESGSDTTAIDHLRQGVEVSTDAHRYAGMLPKLGTNDRLHRLDVTIYGQSNEFVIDPKFEDIIIFDPVVHLTRNVQLNFPFVLDNRSFNDHESFGGFIQPLTIPGRDFLIGPAVYEPHDIHGHLMDGNENSAKSVSRIIYLIDTLETPSAKDLYIDITNSMGTSGSIIIESFFHKNEKLIRPFNDSHYISRTYASGSIRSSTIDLISAVITMAGDSDNYIPAGYIASSAGFTYDNTPLGTDSIAFGGLKRS
jgi:hypothetical protein